MVVAGADVSGQNFVAAAPVAACATPFALGPLQSGLGNNGIVAADFNRDNRLDVAATAQVRDSVSVYLGNGDGTFRTHLDFATAGDSRGLTVGDFNGDGSPDLAVGNFYRLVANVTEVSILLGNGDGTFRTPVRYPVGHSEFHHVATADLNGDARLDLVVARNTGLSVLIGRGDGTFNASVDYPTSTLGRGVAIGDFNGDTRLDLAATDLQNTVNVLLGSGNGTFGAKVPYVVGTGAYDVIARDLNGDGRLDLATANNNGPSVSVLLASGTGTFLPKADFDTGGLPQAIASGTSTATAARIWSWRLDSPARSRSSSATATAPSSA